MKLLAKLIPILTLIISGASIVIGVLWLQQDMVQQAKENSRTVEQYVPALVYQTVLSKVTILEAKMASVAVTSGLAAVFRRSDANEIDLKQQALLAAFPRASKVCLISAGIDDVGEHQCTAISFSTLNSLRKAKALGSAPIGLMKRGTKEAHV